MSFMVIPGDLAFYRILGGVNFLVLNPRDIQQNDFPYWNIPRPPIRKEFGVFYAA